MSKVTKCNKCKKETTHQPILVDQLEKKTYTLCQSCLTKFINTLCEWKDIELSSEYEYWKNNFSS